MTGSDLGPAHGPPEPAVVLDVWADVVCPWCYIAKHRLRRAIDGWNRPHEVLVRHRAVVEQAQIVAVAEVIGERPADAAGGAGDEEAFVGHW